MVRKNDQVVNQVDRYEAEDVQVLEGLEAVRRRPGMYVGGTDLRALHHLVYEVTDNAIDESLAGACDRIEITIHPDSSVTVADNGRGIPTALHPEKKISALQLVMTTLHAGAKFGGGGYKVSGGLHGVGVSAVNALSEWLEIIVDDPRDGRRHRQRYERGVPVTPVENIGKVQGRGTRVTFRFDDTIFKDVDYRFETLAQRMREMAFITRGVTIKLVDERATPFPRRMTFYFEGGIESFVRYLNLNRDVLHGVVYAEQQVNGVGIEVALQYTDAYAESIYAFANTIHTVDGGTHLTGLRSGLTRTVNDYARKAGLLKGKDPNFSGDDVREGLTAIVSVKHPDPQFESQTKVKLMNAEIKGLVESVVVTALSEFLERDSRAARRIVQKCLTSSRARTAARKARDLVIRKSALESLTLPGKLADCSERDSSRTEVFIVEGDSAGGCFHGDTQVALADGRSLGFEEIVAEQAIGKEHFCYTIRRDGQVGLEHILNARTTRANAKVVRVTLDTGETMTCTPDHLFMLRDGSYKPAASLTPDDSLMPLYRTQACEAVVNYNHRIVSVEWLTGRVDVYDIEVPGTHNFALANGVFVHNSAKQGRDRHFQAILPLRGKILNTERARLGKILRNKEVQALISALGTGIGNQFGLDNLRYGRVILLMDADVDGAHIRTLLLTFFFRYMQPLIEEGHLFIAQPPLYRVVAGRKVRYVYTEAEKDMLLKELKEQKVALQRYKGLGEMNPEQLWETTMNPEKRTLLQVTIEDAAAADRTFDMLMGKSVPPRRRFIQTHAKEVRNLDV